MRGPEIVRQIRYRIPTGADLERCIVWAWLEGAEFGDTAGVLQGRLKDPYPVREKGRVREIVAQRGLYGRF